MAFRWRSRRRARCSATPPADDARAPTYDGLTQGIVQLDTQRAFGWHGGLLNVSALQVHGRSLSNDNLLNLQTASGIEADRSTRLWEAWYQQKLLPEDRLDIRIGQQSVDQEFIVTQNGAYFVNTMFGWPMAPSADFPGGGPAYPLSALGVRFRYRPVNSRWQYSGRRLQRQPVAEPRRRSAEGRRPWRQLPAERRNAGDGRNSNTPTRPSAAWSIRGRGRRSDTPTSSAPGTIRNTSTISVSISQGLSLADPHERPERRASHRGQYGVYAVADQMVWRDPKAPNHSVSVFGRAIYVPQGDRNLIDFSLNAGVVLHAPVVTRLDRHDRPRHGLHARRRTARAVSIATPRPSRLLANDPGVYYPVRGSETYIEATYQYQFRPWCQIQPDLQYVFNPGGGIANPDDTHPEASATSWWPACARISCSEVSRPMLRTL